MALALSATEAAIVWPDFPLSVFILNSFTRSVVFTVLGRVVLKIVADILRKSSRKVDIAARIGGDEFVLLLPDTDKPACDILIRRIEEFSQQEFEGRFGKISVSICQATKVGKTEELDWVIRVADENMYRAKKSKQQVMDATSGQ